MPGVDAAFVPFTSDNHQVFLQARRDVLGGPPPCPLPEGPGSERLTGLVRQVRAGRCVLFVGSGMSWQLPSWPGLLGDLAVDLGRPRPEAFDLREALDLAEHFLWERGGSSLAAEIRRRYSEYDRIRFAGYSRVDPNFREIFDEVARLPDQAPRRDEADHSHLHGCTSYLFERWFRVLEFEGLDRLPLAFVAQNGLEDVEDVPWDFVEALFIGGDVGLVLRAGPRPDQLLGAGLWGGRPGRLSSVAGASRATRQQATTLPTFRSMLSRTTLPSGRSLIMTTPPRRSTGPDRHQKPPWALRWLPARLDELW
jgi:hypothetical protein